MPPPIIPVTPTDLARLTSDPAFWQDTDPEEPMDATERRQAIRAQLEQARREVFALEDERSRLLTTINNKLKAARARRDAIQVAYNTSLRVQRDIHEERDPRHEQEDDRHHQHL